MKAAWILVGAIALAGCDGRTGKITYGSVAAPTDSALSGIVTTISPSAFLPSVVGVPCFGSAPGFDLAVTAASTVNVNQVTLRLGDGSTVGGPSVTFPNAALVAQFSSTRILGGSTRLLTFASPFGCRFVTTPLIFADVVFADLSGNMRVVTVSTTLH
jgi:hypothetical protein